MRFKTSGFLKQVCKVKDILSIREWFDESEPVLSSSIFKSPFGECFILYLSSVLPRVISTLKNIVLFVSGGRKAKRMQHFFLEFEKYSFIIFGIKVFHLFYHKTFANKNYFPPPWYFELMVRETCIEFCFVDT